MTGPVPTSYPGDPSPALTLSMYRFQLMQKIAGEKGHDPAWLKKFIRHWRDIACRAAGTTVREFGEKSNPHLPEGEFFKVSTCDELGLDMYDELKAEAERLFTELDLDAELERNRQAGGKVFKVRLNGEMYANPPDSVLTRFALQPRLVELATGYLNVPVRLHSTEIHLDNPLEGDPVSSQYWHYDNLDFKLFKLFVYLRPVAEETGCLGVIDPEPSLHHKSRLARNPRFSKRGMNRLELIDEIIPKESIHHLYGDEGTAVMADTGLTLHRGVPQVSKSRLMYVATFTSHLPYEEWPGSPFRKKYMARYRELNPA